MHRPQPEMDGRNPTSSGGLVLAVVGGVPDGRVLLAGELDMLTAPRLEQLLTDLLSTGYRHVSVDCSGVNFLAGAGLNVFCRATCRYRDAGGRLHLVALPRQTRRVLAITGLDTRLNLERFAEPGPETLPATRSNGAGPAPRTPPHGTRHAHAGTPHRLPAPDPATSLPSQRANSRGRADPD
jgi:anti-anti-sigma factor